MLIFIPDHWQFASSSPLKWGYLKVAQVLWECVGCCSSVSVVSIAAVPEGRVEAENQPLLF